MKASGAAIGKGIRMQRLDMGKAWQDTVAMLRANGEILAVIAGLFFFVPSLLAGLIGGVPPEPSAGTAPEEVLRQMGDYFRPLLPWLALSMIAALVGSLAIWRLLLTRGGTSVGAALSGAFGLFLPYLLASLLAGLVSGIGFLLLIIPGIYLTIRLILTGPHMASHGIGNPIEGLKGSWEITRGNVLSLLLFLVIVVLVGAIIMVIIQTVLGGAFALILPEGLANTLGQVVEALLGAALSLVLGVMYAAIYRQLTPQRHEETFA